MSLSSQKVFDSEKVYGGISRAIATHTSARGIKGVHACGVLIVETNTANKLYTPVINISQIDYLVRTEQAYTNDDSSVSNILNDIDDRLIPGFSELTVLMYSNDTLMSLSKQAYILRHVLIDTFKNDTNVASLLFVSDVRGVMRSGSETNKTDINIGEAIGLMLWAFSMFAVIMIALFCPKWCPQSMAESVNDVSPKKDVDGCCNSVKYESCCTEHSPKDRYLITMLLILIVVTLIGSVVIYVFVVIPVLQSYSSKNNPQTLLTIGWFWIIFIVSTLLVISYCFVISVVRRM